jgi:hypothetical protein
MLVVIAKLIVAGMDGIIGVIVTQPLVNKPEDPMC